MTNQHDHYFVVVNIHSKRKLEQQWWVCVMWNEKWSKWKLLFNESR